MKSSELAGGAAALTFVVLFVVEHARPLRRATQSRSRRLFINAGFAVTAAAAMGAVYGPVVFAAVGFAARHGLGLLRWLPVPAVLRPPLAFVLLDYTLWAWHRLNHRVPFLWRFHAAHHSDLDLDVTTAFRFHFGEQLASVPFRAAQAAVFGIDLEPLLAWEIVNLLFVQFHHSNTRLPFALERLLRFAVVTPRLHGIHHSTAPEDVSANFGIISSIWDRAHQTHRWLPAEVAVSIGLPDIRDPSALTLGRALLLPASRAPIAAKELRP